jgi:hypothetical protein
LKHLRDASEILTERSLGIVVTILIRAIVLSICILIAIVAGEFGLGSLCSVGSSVP